MLASLGLGASMVSGPVGAQAPQRRRVAVLRRDREATGGAPVEAFRARMAELGWVEGRTIEISAGYAGSDPSRAVAIVEAAVAGGAAVIVASSTPVTQAALHVTRRLPIVMAPAAARFVAQSAEAARDLGIELRPLLIASPDELAGAVATLAAEGQQAVLVQPSFVFQRDEIAALARRHRLPTVSELDVLAQAGVLMTYGASGGTRLRFGAGHVDRILRGASPATLPVERPARVELVVNMRTARALDLAIPPSILARADEVIE